MPWGIAVPGDESQVMYVWFDALVNYISAIGWPEDTDSFNKWHVQSGGMVQYCGKDNLRQQSAMWQAMLMAVKLPPSKQIIIDGFVTGEGGIKMSKSLGNTIDPLDVVKNYGTDALRYYVCREVSPFDDSPFTMEKFKDAYNAHLANGLGNLVSRVMKMAEANSIKYNQNVEKKIEETEELLAFYKKYNEGFVEYNLEKASSVIWDIVSGSDKIIQEKQPFKKIKTDKEGAIADIEELVARLHIIGKLLMPILPQTAETIVDLVLQNKMPETPLFIRK